METTFGDKRLGVAADADNHASEPHTSSDEGVDVTEADGPRRGVSLFSMIWDWKPKPAQYDPENPPKFSLALNLLFAFVGILGFSQRPGPSLTF